MTAAEILAKCGMTAEQVRSAAARCARPSRMSIADMNEAKYAGVRLAEDGFRDRCGDSISDRYGIIAESRDNGNCATRAGTWRRYRIEDKAARRAKEARS